MLKLAGLSNLDIETLFYITNIITESEKRQGKSPEISLFAPFAGDVRKLLKIGVNFSSEAKNISEWEVRP